MLTKPTLHRDDRGLAYRIIVFAATAVIGAFFYVALSPAFTDVMDIHRRQTDTAAATTGADWVQLAWDWAPFVVVMLMAVLIIAAAVVESRRP